MTWRVLYHRPAAQHRLIKAIAELAVSSGHSMETYYPQERVWSGQGVRRRACNRPLLPSMIFVKAPDDAIAGLMALDGVWRRLDPTGSSAADLDEFILGLRVAEECGAYDRTLRKKVRMEIGNRVRIAAGSYAGYHATIIGMNRSGRAKVLAAVFGQQTRVNIEVAGLEPLDEIEREAA